MYHRFFDHRLYDLLELGVEKYRGIREFAAAAASVQAGNKVISHCLLINTFAEE